jgi:proline iminopeptidase
MIHGAGDPRPAALAIAEALPQAELAVIPDAGHFPWIERPDEVATALRAFLSALGR